MAEGVIGVIFVWVKGLKYKFSVYENSNNIRNTRSCYPSSKRAAETFAMCYAGEYGADVVIARPCHTYGHISQNRITVSMCSSSVMYSTVRISC